MVVMKLRSRDELPQLLSSVIESIKHEKTKIDIIKENLRTEFSILPGKIQKIINNSEEELHNVSDEFLYLLTNQVYIATGDMNIAPDQFFNEREIKEIKTNYEAKSRERITLPFTFEDVTRVDNDDYITTIEASTIKELYESQLLQYNFETQREARHRKNRSTGEIIEVPKTNPQSVKEIEELFEKGELISSMLTFNARFGSSDNENGELIYDEKSRTLTITKGTLLDALDGFHRTQGIVRGLKKNPHIDKTFKLNVINFNNEKAKQFFGQLNTTNPISKSKIEETKKPKMSSIVADYLKYNSYLKNLVAPSDRIYKESNLLVTFITLSDAINEVYDIENRVEAMQISLYLTKFFNKLFESFPNEFMGNIAEIRNESLINANVMFYGYVLLSKRMKDENVDLDRLPDIVKTIDFSRSNKIWKKFNVLDLSENVTNKARKSIFDYFKKIKIK